MKLINAISITACLALVSSMGHALPVKDGSLAITPAHSTGAEVLGEDVTLSRRSPVFKKIGEVIQGVNDGVRDVASHTWTKWKAERAGKKAYKQVMKDEKPALKNIEKDLQDLKKQKKKNDGFLHNDENLSKKGLERERQSILDKAHEQKAETRASYIRKESGSNRSDERGPGNLTGRRND